MLFLILRKSSLARLPAPETRRVRLERTAISVKLPIVIALAVVAIAPPALAYGRYSETPKPMPTYVPRMYGNYSEKAYSTQRATPRPMVYDTPAPVVQDDIWYLKVQVAPSGPCKYQYVPFCKNRPGSESRARSSAGGPVVGVVKEPPHSHGGSEAAC